jgi:hypothetical protein
LILTHRSETQIVVSDSLNYPVTILFNQRGHITATDGLNNPVNPVFTICSGNCSENFARGIDHLGFDNRDGCGLESGESSSALPFLHQFLTPRAI